MIVSDTRFYKQQIPHLGISFFSPTPRRDICKNHKTFKLPNNNFWYLKSWNLKWQWSTLLEVFEIYTIQTLLCPNDHTYQGPFFIEPPNMGAMNPKPRVRNVRLTWFRGGFIWHLHLKTIWHGMLLRTTTKRTWVMIRVEILCS